MMNYDKKNGDVCFRESDHVYFNERKKDITYTSVTTLIGKYHEKFDPEFWSRYKALEKCLSKEDFTMIKSKMLRNRKADIEWFDKFSIDPDVFNNHVDEILESYRLANEAGCKRGTEYHLKKELAFYENKIQDVSSLVSGCNGSFECEKHNWDLSREKAVIPEFLIYYHCPDGILNIAGQIDLLIKDGNDIYLIDWKGLPLDTPIATPNGWSFIKDLSPGDVIYDRDGKETKIVNVSDVHHNPCYKIKFDTGEEIVADHEHRWVISFRRGKGKYKEVVMTTEEISLFLKKNKRTTYNIPRILNAKPLDIKDVELPLDPYLLGAWLGDGSKSCGVITNINRKFWEEVSNRGFSYGENLSDDNHAEMRTVYNIVPALKSLNLIKNKHIPDLYLRSSYNQRLDLLRGLMDTDGYYNKKRNRYVMSTGQKWQSDDLCKLLSSLGIKPTVFFYKKKLNNKLFDVWDVCFTTSINPFLIRNQDIVFNSKSDNYSFRNITSVEVTETVPTQCLEVDSESHTFLAGYNLIVTHNTNSKGIKEKAFFDPVTKKLKTMFYPLNNLNDTMLIHYTLQLSLYAWMMQKINPSYNIKLLRLHHIDGNDVETDYDLIYLKDDVERLLKYHKKTMMNGKNK